MTMNELLDELINKCETDDWDMEEFLVLLKNRVCLHCGKIYEMPRTPYDGCVCWNDE